MEKVHTLTGVVCREVIDDAALINSLSALQLGKQYVAVTQKGCDAVRIEKEIPISYLEKLFSGTTPDAFCDYILQK